MRRTSHASLQYSTQSQRGNIRLLLRTAFIHRPLHSWSRSHSLTWRGWRLSCNRDNYRTATNSCKRPEMFTAHAQKTAWFPIRYVAWHSEVEKMLGSSIGDDYSPRALATRLTLGGYHNLCLRRLKWFASCLTSFSSTAWLYRWVRDTGHWGRDA